MSHYKQLGAAVEYSSPKLPGEAEAYSNFGRYRKLKMSDLGTIPTVYAFAMVEFGSAQLAGVRLCKPTPWLCKPPTGQLCEL